MKNALVANEILLFYECSTPNISRLGSTSFMDPKYIPGVKSEGIPLQPQPSTSVSTSAVSTATYRDFFAPSAGTAAYQHPMHSFFSGFEFPRPSLATQQPELMQSTFATPGFATPSFVDPTHSQPPPAHQRIEKRQKWLLAKIIKKPVVVKSDHGLISDQSTAAFQFPYATVVPTAMASDNHRANQQSLRSGPSNLQAIPSGNESLSTDKLCAVCNDRAVCQHYGARTCEGCKGFFKRTVQKKAQYVCTGNKNCTIDKRFRSRCQYCRFQKCIAVGMVKEVVRYGSLSGRRGRLPSKTKVQHSDDPPSPPLPLLTLINKAYIESKTIATPTLYVRVPSRPRIHNTGGAEQLLSAMDEEFRFMLLFVEKIPNSTEISQNDITKLIERNFFALLALKLCYGWTEGGSLHMERIEVDISTVPQPLKLLFTLIQEEAKRFQHLLQWDPPSFSALFALQFLNTKECGGELLSSDAAVDKLRGTITSALKDHCCNSSPPHTKKLQTIIAQIEVFARFQRIGQETLSLAVSSGVQLPPLMSGAVQTAQRFPGPSKLDFTEFSFCP
ncbi:unnamed protein product [Litomosoides sigmodontis]|uniref:Nuclear receptor domain-containing protein n=1 Tax=Litomosoides sigmodontis TaxID=42156 RepID=A0A3P6SZY0_LITSI|nr:unnamed protein product [Litomosoides sigmodontis]